MEALRVKYAGTADFAKVYVSEAHPVDEWKVYSDIDYCQPKTLEARMTAAGKMLSMKDVKIGATMLVDTMENTAEQLYSAHPERLYIVDRSSGRIVYKGAMGPFGYHPEEIDCFLSKVTSAQHRRRLGIVTALGVAVLAAMVARKLRTR
eukprot:gnl/TRDRNA2_/TRDRNA2_79172_c1_seq1.p1 gnl/TRDRNA2_/TRDRNA2_79172_c1~~gnl/TRDRNA2_/TRDRNA2_79172_c1_seq1.p1  ORF type:complete len:149 (-),score=31.96 gnl/TRDRNA2_/TRDRNA2_79172_c1_seq1:142-588(-)